MTAAEITTCIITLRLSKCKSQGSLSLFPKHHELTSQNVSYFLINESKTKDSCRKPLRPVKPLRNSTRPYLNEIPPHFIHEIRTKGYDVIGMSDSPTKKGLIRPVRYIYKIKTGVGYCVSQLFPFFEKIQRMGDNENPADFFIG